MIQPFLRCITQIQFLFLASIIFLLACNNPTISQANEEIDFPGAKQVTLEMASGINLGNVFDLGAHEFNFYELATIISIYQKEGMKHYVYLLRGWIR